MGPSENNLIAGVRTSQASNALTFLNSISFGWKLEAAFATCCVGNLFDQNWGCASANWANVGPIGWQIGIHVMHQHFPNASTNPPPTTCFLASLTHVSLRYVRSCLSFSFSIVLRTMSATEAGEVQSLTIADRWQTSYLSLFGLRTPQIVCCYINSP